METKKKLQERMLLKLIAEEPRLGSLLVPLVMERFNCSKRTAFRWIDKTVAAGAVKAENVTGQGNPKRYAITAYGLELVGQDGHGVAQVLRTDARARNGLRLAANLEGSTRKRTNSFAALKYASIRKRDERL